MKQLVFFITCFFCLQQSFGQYTLVPDPNFEQALIDLGIDSEGVLDGQFLTTDAVGVSTLNIDEKNIFDLTGIEAFTDLNQLFAHNNNLSNVDLSLLPETMWTLNLGHNNLNTIDLSPIPNIVNLYLGSNNFTQIDASNLTSLFIFHLSNQNITNLNLTNCTNLFSLGCRNTALQSLDLSTCQNLAFLACFDSQLTSLDFTGNLEIEEIRTYNNPLTSISLPNNPNLELLRVSNTLLTELDLTNCSGLMEVSFISTAINQIDFSSNSFIERIWGTDSQLASLDITNNPNLIEVWCRNNNISGTIDFSNNLQLDDIDFSYNQLEEIDLSQNSALEWVFVDNNPNLQFVNMQNGYNENLFAFVGVDCPQLSCVVVDDPIAENDNIFVDDNTILVGSPEDCNLAIDEAVLQQLISMYPNPVKDVLHVNTQNSIAINSIQIFNILGSVVYKTDHLDSLIDVSNLASGLLFVKLETNKGVITKKVIKL